MGQEKVVPAVGEDVTHMMAPQQPAGERTDVLGALLGPMGGRKVAGALEGIGRWVTENPAQAGALAATTAATGGLLGAPAAVAIPAMGLYGAAGAGAGMVADRVLRSDSQPLDVSDTLTTMGAEGAKAAGSQYVGGKLGEGMRAGGQWLMQKALKPTQSILKEYRTTAPELVQTLLDEGVNVTSGGVEKLQRLFDATNDEIAVAVNNATGAIPKERVAARALETGGRVAKQTNPTKDLQTVGNTVEEFLDHPVYKGDLSVPEAQAMKIGTYQRIGKKYGELSSAAIETEKALARGLKEEIAAEVPGLAGLNARDGKLIAALDAVGRRVALSGNMDPVGFAWVTSHPTTFLAALFDRNPAVKSFIARGMYDQAGKVGQASPQLIRVAVAALAQGGPAPIGAPIDEHELGPAPGSRGLFERPANQSGQGSRTPR